MRKPLLIPRQRNVLEDAPTRSLFILRSDYRDQAAFHGLLLKIFSIRVGLVSSVNFVLPYC